MGDVVHLNIQNAADIPVADIIADASAANLDTAIVIGETPEGELYVALSSSDAPLNGWLIDQAKALLLKMSAPDEAL